MERESSLGGRLRRLMEEEGLSYEQLGERLEWLYSQFPIFSNYPN